MQVLNRYQIPIHRKLRQQRSYNLEKRIHQQQYQRDGDYPSIRLHVREKPAHQARIVSFAENLFVQVLVSLAGGSGRVVWVTTTRNYQTNPAARNRVAYESGMNGLVLVDKPSGCTSHDVVNRWRKLAGTKRVGHLGTLDPMATGLLVLLTGTATRLAQFLEKAEKTYVAEIVFGVISNTFDADGQLQETGVPLPSDPDLVYSALRRFEGRFLQTPPPVSAKKINGVPAYKLARRQLPVQLKPVEVEVKRLDVDALTTNSIVLRVTCSAGTYIRSLAHDLGEQLGCGALLTSLRRTQAGEFSIEQARTLDALAEFAAAGRLSEAIIPASRILTRFPAEYVDTSTEAHIRQGRDFRTSPFVVPPGAPFVRALSHSGELIAIGELRIPNLYHPSTVL